MKYISLAVLLIATNLFASQNFHPHRVIVKMKKNYTLTSTKTIERVRSLFGNVYVAWGGNSLDLKKELLKRDDVLRVEHDYISSPREIAKELPFSPVVELKSTSSVFNDPMLNKQWTFRPAKKSGISVEEAYTNSRGRAKEEIIVAVVDTGLDVTHNDLKDIVWVNKGEIAGNGIDDDGNGYIDDINGINTLVRDSNGNATGNITDSHSHGTHVSGTIGAIQNNGIGIAGVASNVKIMGIRTVPNNGDETDVDVIESFIYAAKHGAKIINCSFGKSKNEGGLAVSEAIELIGTQYGTLVIAAAGNSSRNIDRRLTYPASFPNNNLLVVASTTSRGSMSYFSNYGIKNVDVAAPGSGILSTTPRNRYSNMSGTSMASPTVAGLAAEILSQNSQLSVLELKDVIIKSVTKMRRFKSKILSGGRVDLNKALTEAQTR